jgi:hypothetical protein
LFLKIDLQAYPNDSLGILLGTIFNNDVPYKNNEDIVANKIDWLCDLELSFDLTLLICAALTKDPSARPNLTQLSRYAWLTSVER